MIWVGILEIGIAVMFAVALVIAAVHDIRHIREEKRTGVVKCCGMCKHSFLAQDGYYWCRKRAEEVDEFFWCKKWER